ncbi:MAG: energy transducer TonB [Gemmatimonadales bacterium]
MAPGAPRLTGGVVASIVLHGSVVGAVIFLRPAAAPPTPPLYRVHLIAAPPGPMATGVVQEPPSSPPPETRPTPTPKSVPVRPKAAPPKAKPKPTPEIATPVEQPKTAEKATTPPPMAGGGETGGSGSDVAPVNTAGIDFPYPGYLSGIANSVLRFFGHSRMSYTAGVRFEIRRDGSVDPASIKLVTSSGNYSFDQQALGAVESAANAKAFGPLPPGYHDDILPVNFRFSPTLIR